MIDDFLSKAHYFVQSQKDMKLVPSTL